MMQISVIVPCFKRIGQTVKSLDLVLQSKGRNTEFGLELIAADSTPTNELRLALKNEFGEKVIYTKPQKPGIAANKNQGAKIAKGDILIFCDSDIEVEEDTLINTATALKKHEKAAALGGQVIWRGGPKDGSHDRPREEDRMLNIDGTTFIEALYSRYFATYKKVFLNVGGYDEEVFNMRGEGSDLSICYWREGYPLVYEETIIVHHVHDVPDSAALRVDRPELSIAKDLLLLGYKYDILDEKYKNFMNTVVANFKQFGDDGYFRIIEGIGNYLDFITEAKPKLDEQKKNMKTLYDFKFLEVFSQKELFEDCINKAAKKLENIRKSIFI